MTSKMLTKETLHADGGHGFKNATLSVKPDFFLKKMLGTQYGPAGARFL